MGEGHDLVLGEAPELVADHLVILVEAGGAEGRRALPRQHQLDEPLARGIGIALRQRPEIRGPDAEIRRAGDLALAHRNAAGQLRQVFAGADLEDQRLHLAEAARLGQPERPGMQLAEALDIGRHPGQRMGGRLIRLERGIGDAPAGADARRQPRLRGGEEGAGRGDGLGAIGEQVGRFGDKRGGGMGHRLRLLSLGRRSAAIVRRGNGCCNCVPF